MNRFAALIDRLGTEPRRNAKVALITHYLRETPDPERGLALAAITGELTFKAAKPALIRTLISQRTDPVLFALSYDYVGDLSETVALMWPAPAGINEPPPGLAEVVERLSVTGRSDMPALIAGWLDRLDETGRWAMLKLITGGLRIGVSARLAKTAVAGIGGIEPDAVELVWHGLKPPYLDLFAWVEGRAPMPGTDDPAPFRPPMLAHALDEAEFADIDPAIHAAEWKWDGIRVEAAAGTVPDGTRRARLYARSGDDISAAFPDLVGGFGFDATLDGELLIVIEGRVQSFNTLQQRLNRKTVTRQMLAELPAHIRAYDLLIEAGTDLRPLPFAERRARLEALVTGLADPRLSLSPLIAFADREALAAARADPAAAGAGADAQAIEGVMIKRLDAPYLPGRPKGLWYKWKRDPFSVDCVLMYAQRGHGKRSSYYSDYTFGVWRGAELVPVGKAYFGFTDAEMREIDGFVKANTLNRFGPVREVAHAPDHGLVFEIAFEGLARSGRHKSGLAMRFPRIARIRRDKRPDAADRIETLEAMLQVAQR